MIQTAQRMEGLSAHIFASIESQIVKMEQSGARVIRLDIGSPDLPPAPAIIDALQRSAEAPDRHGYQTHRGPERLRSAWAEMYQRVHGVELDPHSEVLPLIGSKEGIFHLPVAFINPGDIALIPDPGYITYTRGAILSGGIPYYLPLLEQNGYLPDLEAIPAAILKRAKLLWLNYPNNPTAGIAPLEFFERAVSFAREHHLLLCHDAAYSQVTFDGYRAPSLLQVSGAKEIAVEFNTLSKSHNMAGWRVAAALGNADALRALYTLKTNLDSSSFLPVMDAAVQAMTGDQAWTVERNAVYQERRDILIAGLQGLGLLARIPRASLYIWCPVPPGSSSVEFASFVLEQARVSLTPGVLFGPHGEGYVRIALTAPTAQVCEAVERVKAVLSNYHWGER
ncbi:MAG: aminotransferase class I/II-fold pyridoxal phosphate-dependent enzyme [Omnitrophica WOR_2 bacterium]